MPNETQATELTSQEFIAEIEKDLKLGINPDLRRLGKYRVVLDPGVEALTINLDLSNKDLNLGEGDFTNGFVGFYETKVNNIDFGKSKFSKIYLDYLNAREINFNEAAASSIMFDRARTERCILGNFRVGELYFDEFSSEIIDLKNLKSGCVFVGKLKPTHVEFGNNQLTDFKVLFDEGGSEQFGDIPKENFESNNFEKIEIIRGGEEITLTVTEFLDRLNSGFNIANLGGYKVISDGTNVELNISIDIPRLDFGLGDFSQVRVSFTDSKIGRLNLGKSIINSLNFTNQNIATLELNNSKIDTLHFDNTVINSIFCERSNIKECGFEESQLDYIFLNHFQFENLRFGNSKIKEVYATTGSHGNIYFEDSEISLFNGQEAKFTILDFGEAHVNRVVMRGTSADTIRAEHLKANLFFVGYYDNVIGEMHATESTMGQNEGIKHLLFHKIVPNELDREYIESRRQKQIPSEFKLS